MNNVLLVLQGFIALGLVAVILLQRSEGGALGMGGGPGGLMSSRSAGNVLTRATTWLAAAFIGMCLLLGWQLNNYADTAEPSAVEAAEQARALEEAAQAAQEGAQEGTGGAATFDTTGTQTGLDTAPGLQGDPLDTLLTPSTDLLPSPETGSPEGSTPDEGEDVPPSDPENP